MNWEGAPAILRSCMKDISWLHHMPVMGHTKQSPEFQAKESVPEE